MAIKIITDSTSYIDNDVLKKYDIKLVSLSAVVDGENIRELDIEHNAFFEKMQKAKTIPTSSQPAIGEMYEAFENIVKNGDEAIGVFISSKMSGTYATALLVKEQILAKYKDAKIEIIDSLSNCMQLGYVAIQAAVLASEGKSIDECVKGALYVREHSRFLFTPEVLDYLRKGGRIGGASALLGNLLQIKPILTVDKGETNVYAKVRTKKKAIDTIMEGMHKDLENAILGGITVHHINCENEGLEVAKKIEEKFNIKADVLSIGPIIGVHVGPGAIGLAYWWKSAE